MAGNMFDYLNWRGDLTFKQSAFNVVDSLVLSTLCFLKYKGSYEEPTDYKTAFEETMKEYVEYNDPIGFFPKVTVLSREVLNTRRFKDIKVFHHVDHFSEEEEKQFSATTYLIGDDTAFVAFRGTDETMVGWKEDFNMAFSDDIPSHSEAVEYINYVAQHLDRPLRIGGHSKGAHLAIWAAAHLKDEYKDRIYSIYNHDGPGFSKEFLESKGFKDIKDKVFSFVPSSSIVGVLMNYLEYIPIKSDALPIIQHDPFSWLIEGRRFIYELDRTKIGKLMEKYGSSLYAASGKGDMKGFIDDAYSFLKKSGDIADGISERIDTLTKKILNKDK